MLILLIALLSIGVLGGKDLHNWANYLVSDSLNELSADLDAVDN